MLSKVKRDQARLFGLVRKEKESSEANEQAFLLLREVYGLQPEEYNVKTAKLMLLKGLCISKFNLDKSTECLIESA